MKHRHNWSGQDGSVLLVVMLLCSIMMLASAAMVALSANAGVRMRRQLQSVQALQIAEAGIADMIGRLRGNYLLWQDSTNAASFAGGDYRVVSATQPGGNVIVTSTGRLGSSMRVTAMELLGTDRNRNDDLFSLKGAILSGGDVRFSSSAFTIRGNVHSNGSITSSNGAQNGNMYAGIGDDSPAIVSAVNTIGDLQGTHQPNTTVRELPTFNFDSYRDLAQSDGLYLEGDQVLRNWHGTPANGIVYVNGNVRVRNNSSLVGTLVANGDITLENNFTQTEYAAGMPALLATGNVTMGNRGQIEGLVYAGINAYVSNNVVILGGIMSVGFTEINNNADVYHPAVKPNWDPLQPTIPPDVIVGGWLR